MAGWVDMEEANRERRAATSLTPKQLLGANDRLGTRVSQLENENARLRVALGNLYRYCDHIPVRSELRVEIKALLERATAETK